MKISFKFSPRLARLTRIEEWPRWTLASPVLATFLLLAGTPVGEALNSYLYLSPIERIRARLGFAPTIAEDVRIVLFEDRSLAKLGRAPTLAEWFAVASRLFELGVESVYLAGIHESEIDLAEKLPAQKQFFAGVVLTDSAGSLRARSVESIASSLMAPKVDGLPALSASSHAFGAQIAASRVVDTIGIQNLPDARLAPLGFNLANGRALLQLAVLGSPAKNVRFYRDGDVYINYVTSESVASRSLPIAAFFDGSGSRVVDRLGKRVEQFLEGAKVALLVPDSFTGSRFVETPTGRELSFFATASLLTSARSGFWVHRLELEILVTMAMAVIAAFCAMGLKLRVSLAILATTASLLAILATVFLQRFGLVLPVAPAILLSLVAAIVRLLSQGLATLRDRIRYQSELEFGRLVQVSTWPTKLKAWNEHWEYELILEPHGALSGDWVQVAEPDTDRIVVAIGDVVGKGASAALNTTVVACLWGQLKSSFSRLDAPFRDLLLSLNQAISQTFRGTQNTTISLARLEGDCAIITARGAPQWLYFSAETRTFSTIRTRPENPLGMVSLIGEAFDAHWKNVPVKSGDALVAVTDGVLDGQEEMRRFRECAASLVASGLPLARAIADAGRQVSKQHSHPDDFTMAILLKR